MTREERLELLTEALAQKQYHLFTETVDTMNAVDVADFLSTLTGERLLVAFRLLKKDSAADVFAELDGEAIEQIVSATKDTDLALLVDDLFIDDAVDLLEELPASMVKRILRVTNPETRRLINKFLSYPENSAGSVMTAEFIDLKETMTVSEAVARIRRTGVDKETVYTAYIIDSARHLHGTVSLKDLLFADSDALLSDIMSSEVVMATTSDDREEVAAMISKYDLLSLPIVDREQRLVGIVTVDDALDVMEEEATEDIEKMAALVPDNRPYLRSRVLEIFKKRIPWLLLLMVSATFTGEIIAGFEESLALFPALIAFIPMLMDTGGNSGGQASVTIIRGLALGEISMKDIFRIIWIEIRVGFICGMVLSVCNFVKILLIDNLIFHNGVSLRQAAVVCITLVCTVVVAKFVGGTLPVLAKRIGLDPAVMASPFITTIVDAVSLIIYFRIALLLLM
ncbi:MAG: magnesium transporter [Clostridia bacterium]|nr:magnesium transporter [Clostridia bacterium]